MLIKQINYLYMIMVSEEKRKKDLNQIIFKGRLIFFIISALKISIKCNKVKINLINYISLSIFTEKFTI